MSVRQIVLIGEDILRLRSREVTVFDQALFELLDDLKETLADAHGAGLAAPQIGVLRRAFVVDDGTGPIELINPKIIKTSGASVDYEGCLSVPERHARIERPAKVKVEAQDRTGQFFTLSGSGLLARALCHENDHLNGVLYVDLIDPELNGPEEKSTKKAKRKRR